MDKNKKINNNQVALKPSFYEKHILPYKKQKVIMLMFLPLIIYYIIFAYGPMYGLTIVFKDYVWLDGIMKSPWAGLENFKVLFSNPEFWTVFKNTLILSLYKLIFAFPASIILALLLNEVRNVKFKKLVQTASYLPHFLSWVVLAGIVATILSPSTGVVNAILGMFGIDPIYFLGNPKTFRGVVVISHIWKEIGWGTIVYLAALTNVDPQLYEAAALDGAGKFRQIINVTLPAISQAIVIMFIFAVGNIVKDDFDQIFNLYNPAVYSVGDVMSTFIYRMGLEQAMYSVAAAAGLFNNVIAFTLVLITNYVSGKVSEYQLW